MATIEEHELSERRTSAQYDHDSIARAPSIRDERALPPADRGFKAWSFLAAAFLAEAIVWGVPETFGVFLAYYLNDPQYMNQKHASSLLPLIGTLCTGLMYCLGLIIHPLMRRYPRFARRYFTWIGAAICWASLFGASYTRSVIPLVLLQGIGYAIGGSLLYSPCIMFVTEWFVERQSFANGVIFAGTALGGLVFPLVLPAMIDAWGPAVTTRVLSVAIVCAIGPMLPFVRGRLPDTRVYGPAARSSDRLWMKNPMFWTLILVNTLQSFAYFVPIVWLPTFATSMGLGASKSSLSIALLYGTSFVSRLGLGACADRYNPWTLALSTLSAASACVFLLWGVLSTNVAGLVAFGLAYGLVAGGWSSLWSGFLRPITRNDPTLSTTLFGVLMISRGLGSTLATPISTALLRGIGENHQSWKSGFQVAGGRYEQLIVYVGTCFAASAAVSAVGLGMHKQRRQ